MNKFKVGDRVRVTNVCNATGNATGIIKYLPQDNMDTAYYAVKRDDCITGAARNNLWNVREVEIELISTTTSGDRITISKSKPFMSSIIEKAKLALKGEPQKSFQKAGITDSSDSLTPDGEVVFLNWLFQSNAVAFKTEIVDAILKEEAK